MKTKSGIDIDAVTAVLGAEFVGPVDVRHGAFGSAELIAEVQARLKVPATGGRATDPRWTEKRLVPFASETLKQLQEQAALLSQKGTTVSPMQFAARIIEANLPGVAPSTGRAERVLGKKLRPPAAADLDLWDKAA